MGGERDKLKVPRNFAIADAAEREAQNDGDLGKKSERPQIARPATLDRSWSLPLSDKSLRLSRLLQLGIRETPMASKDGRWSFLNLARQLQKRGAEKQLRNALAKQGAVLFPFLVRQATVYWNPVVVTDAKGRAQIKVQLPDRSASWTIVAIGITKQQQAGMAQKDVSAQRDVDAELVLPSVLTAGDLSGVRAIVHSKRAIGKVQLTLSAKLGNKTTQLRLSEDINQAGMTEFLFEKAIQVPSQLPANVSSLQVRLAMQYGKGQERIYERQIALRPNGSLVQGYVSGIASADEVVRVALPAGLKANNLKLQIRLGRPMNPNFFAFALRRQLTRYGSKLEQLANEVLSGVALHQWFAKSGGTNSEQLASIHSQVSRAVADLVARQLATGSWNRKGQSDLGLVSQIVWALAEARKAGYAVPQATMVRATSYLRSQVALAEPSDYRNRVYLLHALVLLGRDEFTLANQLNRQRNSMDAESVVHLAVAFAHMKRLDATKELIAMIGRRNTTASSARFSTMYLLALQQAKSDIITQRQVVKKLMVGLKDCGWHPIRATGPAIFALAQFHSAAAKQAPRIKVAVDVNGKPAGVVSFDNESAQKILQVPQRLLKGLGRQDIRFRLQGRGDYAYACTLGGVVASKDLRSSTKKWVVKRFYSPPATRRFGKTIRGGFSILEGNFTRFRNPLSELPVGEQGGVEIQIRPSKTDLAKGSSAPRLLSVWEPLPPGVEIVPGSIRGDHLSEERHPGAIHFMVDGRKSCRIQFAVHGMVSGNWQVPATIVRQSDRPDLFAVAPARKLSVLKAGKKSSDPYRLTPNERLAIGKTYFSQKKHKEAVEHLGPLMESWDLKPNHYREVAEMLMRSHLQIGPPKRAVHYFEMIIEKFPRLPVQFDDYLRIGAAYQQLQEFERGYLVFRAIVQANFQRESYVAGSLDQLGRQLRSVESLSNLLRDYPPEPYAASAQYALCQRVYRRSSSVAINPELRSKGITSGDLIRRSLGMLRQYLTEYPDDPAADEAALSVVTGLVEMGAYRRAIDACLRFEKRYAKSHLLDDFWYVRGYCHYWLGERKAALAVCQLVDKHKYRAKPTSAPLDSENKDRAVYILGQVYHSLDQTAPALLNYRRIQTTIPQARDAIAMLTAKQLKVPEVTTIVPNRPAEIELSYRNVRQIETTVYRIDLMKFSLLQRNLSGINRIQLAGIRPQHRVTTKLVDVEDYRRKKKLIRLPLKDEGAYLVVTRGDGIYASGLVLISPLKLEVASRVSGRVQAIVRDSVKKRYLSRVQVRIIGSNNVDFVSGQTDLRGVFVAEAIQGAATVIVQVNKNQYAFYRGKTNVNTGLGNAQASTKRKKGGTDVLLDGVLDGHRRLQSKQQSELEALYKGLRNVDGTMSNGGGMGGGFGGGGLF